MKRWIVLGAMLLATPAVAAFISFGLNVSGLPSIVFSSISSGAPTSSSATITWTNTPAAQGQVCYGLTTAYGTCSTRDASPITSDSATLSGLTASTAYHYQINATASGYTQSYSSDQTFTTASGGLVQLPQAWPTITQPAVTNIVLVHSGNNLQTAINAATPGTALILDAGATFTSPFNLPNTTCGGGWITIESSSYNNFQPGLRVAASNANMATITHSTNNYGFSTNAGTCNYWIGPGIEITSAGGVTSNDSYSLISIGVGNQPTLAGQPKNFVIDRDWLHEASNVDTTHGVTFSGQAAALINSQVTDIHSNSGDAQAIYGAKGAGPYLVQNNELDAAGENILWGGDDINVSGQNVSDVTMVNNHMYKPVSWNGVWTDVKNLFELKSCVRCLAEYNVLENSWNGGQPYGIIMRSANQGATPWIEVGNVTFAYNIIKNVDGAFTIGANNQATVLTHDVWMHDNLFYNFTYESDLSGAAYSGFTGTFGDIWIENNTFVSETGPYPWNFYFDSATSNAPPAIIATFYMDNNVWDNMHFFSGTLGTLTAWANYVTSPPATYTGNVDIGGSTSGFPSGNFYPSAVSAPFVDAAHGNFNIVGNPYPSAGSSVMDWTAATPICTSTSGVRSMYLGNTLLVFNASDTLVCSAGFTATEVLSVGGGSGSGCSPGGGGQVTDQTGVAIASGSTTITVGAGGTAGNCSTSTTGGSGGTSTVGSVSASGGAYNSAALGTSNSITGTPWVYGCGGGIAGCSADPGTINSTTAAPLAPVSNTGDAPGSTTSSYTGRAGAAGTIIISCAVGSC